MEPRGSFLRAGVGGCKLRVGFALRPIALVCTCKHEYRPKKPNTCGPSFAFFFPVTVLELVIVQVNDQNVLAFNFFYSINAPHVIYK